MQMRIRFSHIPLAALAATLVAGLGCQSAKKPTAPLLPVSQGAPPPVQSKSAAPAPSGSAHPAVAPVKPTPQTAIQAPAKPDPVQELVTKAETAYKAGLEKTRGDGFVARLGKLFGKKKIDAARRSRLRPTKLDSVASLKS